MAYSVWNRRYVRMLDENVRTKMHREIRRIVILTEKAFFNHFLTRF